MKVLEIKPNDFANYRDPMGRSSLFVGMGSCDWKCCVEAGISPSVCQNYELVHSMPKEIDARLLIAKYIGESRSIVVGGLEPLRDMGGLLELAEAFHDASVFGGPSIFVLYTGYELDEVRDKIADVQKELGADVAFIVKFGRFVPGKEEKFDPVLGVKLASPNQHAEVICGGRQTTEALAGVDSNARDGAREAVDHPTYYKSHGIEAIDVIRAFDLNFSLGNAVKYILRAGRKDKSREIEDLKKAAWYLNEEIKWRTPTECARLESGGEKSPMGS